MRTISEQIEQRARELAARQTFVTLTPAGIAERLGVPEGDVAVDLETGVVTVRLPVEGTP